MRPARTRRFRGPASRIARLSMSKPLRLMRRNGSLILRRRAERAAISGASVTVSASREVKSRRCTGFSPPGGGFSRRSTQAMGAVLRQVLRVCRGGRNASLPKRIASRAGRVGGAGRWRTARPCRLRGRPPPSPAPPPRPAQTHLHEPRHFPDGNQTFPSRATEMCECRSPAGGQALGAGIRWRDRKGFPARHWPKSFSTAC